MSNGSGWCQDSHLIKISDVFELTNTCAQSRSFGVGTAGESYFDHAWSIAWRQRAREQARSVNGLEVVRFFF